MGASIQSGSLVSDAGPHLPDSHGIVTGSRVRFAGVRRGRELLRSDEEPPARDRGVARGICDGSTVIPNTHGSANTRHRFIRGFVDHVSSDQPVSLPVPEPSHHPTDVDGGVAARLWSVRRVRDPGSVIGSSVFRASVERVSPSDLFDTFATISNGVASGIGDSCPSLPIERAEVSYVHHCLCRDGWA